jgi:hypothetical protein
MIHEYETHYWLGHTPNGWISMADHRSDEEIFSQIDLLRLEPLCDLSYQVVFEVAKPEGYTLYWRIRPHTDIQTNQVIGVEYLIAIEKGNLKASDAAAIDISELKHIDGFAVILQLDGSVDFNGTWQHEIDNENGIPIYRFMR